MYADKSALTGSTKRRFRDVTIPETGDTFRLRSLSDRERSKYETDTLTKSGKVNTHRVEDSKRRLLVLTLVDAEGNRLFRDNETDQLADVDGLLIGRLFDAAREHCGFEEGDVEELAKNSVEIDAGDSYTG